MGMGIEPFSFLLSARISSLGEKRNLCLPFPVEERKRRKKTKCDNDKGVDLRWSFPQPKICNNNFAGKNIICTGSVKVLAKLRVTW